jgi:hypothetical protein
VKAQLRPKFDEFIASVRGILGDAVNSTEVAEVITTTSLILLTLLYQLNHGLL